MKKTFCKSKVGRGHIVHLLKIVATLSHSRYVLFMLLLMSIVIIMACSDQTTVQTETSPQQNQEHNTTNTNQASPVKAVEDPVTIKLFFHTRFTDEDYEKIAIDEILKKKYPYITVERIPPQDYNQLLATGSVPDLVFTYNGMLLEFSEVGLVSDLNGYVKQFNIDTAVFESSIIQSMINDAGELLAIPFSDQIRALYYNKAIFDKYGVDYPQDGMSWDDAYEVARRVTGEDAGIQYSGLDPGAFARIVLQNNLDFIDYKTHAPNVNSDEMKYVFELLNRIWTIPGNNPQTNTNRFIKDQTTAMYAYVNILDLLGEPTRNGFEWDMAQYPSMPGRPNLSHPVDAHILTIPQTSNNKEAAMKFIDVMISEEVQMNSVRKTARVSPLIDPQYKENYAAELDFVQGKNIEGIFKSKPFYAPFRSKHYASARGITETKFKEYLGGAKDMNTALREAEQEIIQYVNGQEGR